MQCPSCRKTIPDESKVCSQCGASVAGSEVAAGVQVNCARCEGTGKQKGMFGASDCPACHGKGSVRVSPPPRKCPLCEGSGYQEGFVNKPICGVCWGTGWADVLR